MVINIHPVHAINRYLWSLIQRDAILNQDNYKPQGSSTGIIPIVPVQETLDLIQIIDAQPGTKSFPYIVYTWSKLNNGQMWFMKTHQLAYSIRSADDLATRQLVNLFEHEFEDYDAAARRVNEYIQANGTEAHKRYHFKHINVATLGGGMPSESEAGVSEALITLSVTFTES